VIQAAPVAIKVNNTRTNPFIVIGNSGSQNFDVYAGPFTRNDQLTASPYQNSFLYIPDVPLKYAKQVLPAMNNAATNEKRELLEEREREVYAMGGIDAVYRKWLEEMDKRGAEEMLTRGLDAQNPSLTLGYVTKDVRVPILLTNIRFFFKTLTASLFPLVMSWSRR
jgi:hypothetical protein